MKKLHFWEVGTQCVDVRFGAWGRAYVLHSEEVRTVQYRSTYVPSTTCKGQREIGHYVLPNLLAHGHLAIAMGVEVLGWTLFQMRAYQSESEAFLHSAARGYVPISEHKSTYVP